jgi:hypothetical protein
MFLPHSDRISESFESVATGMISAAGIRVFLESDRLHQVALRETMKAKELREYRTQIYLKEGPPQAIQMAQPYFERLLDKLAALPESATEAEKLACFEECVSSLNVHEHDIETVARDAFCDALYEIGSIVGLDEKTNYVDYWRSW